MFVLTPARPSVHRHMRRRLRSLRHTLEAMLKLDRFGLPTSADTAGVSVTCENLSFGVTADAFSLPAVRTDYASLGLLTAVGTLHLIDTPGCRRRRRSGASSRRSARSRQCAMTRNVFLVLFGGAVISCK